MGTPESTGLPAAGWYPDPVGELSRIRYWNGRSWTDHFQTLLDSSPPLQRQAAERAATRVPRLRRGR